MKRYDRPDQGPPPPLWARVAAFAGVALTVLTVTAFGVLVLFLDTMSRFD